MPFISILECSDGSYYVRSSWNVLERVGEHNDGPGAAYARNRLSATLASTEEYESIAAAFGRENEVHNRSCRKHRALIAGRPDLPGIIRRAMVRARERPSDDRDPGPPQA